MQDIITWIMIIVGGAVSIFTTGAIIIYMIVMFLYKVYNAIRYKKSLYD